MSINPGPQSVNYSYYTGDSPADNHWDKRDWFINLHQAHKDRVQTTTEISNGNWYVVWPDLTRTPEAPTVANLVEMGINHWAAIGGAMLPSIKVPAPVAMDASEGRRGARKRERRLRELWRKSMVNELSAMAWGDYAGAGVAVVGVWADFSEKNPAKRNPYLVRYDPRFTYPLKDDLGNITEMLVAWKISRSEIAAKWPGYADRFSKSRDSDLEEQFWFTKDYFMHCVIDTSKTGREKSYGVVLSYSKNTLGFVPVYEIVRPTFDGQRRGVFDQTLHLLRTMHRLMTLTIYSTEENAFPAIFEYDTINPGAYAPGAVIRARSADSTFERLAPSNHFDVKDLIARLGEEGKMQSTWPQQLSGEPGASINSARGIDASMGALNARLALAHKQFELLFGRASEFLLAFDEVYCPGSKTIYGDSRDRKKAEEFNTARDIGGAWDVVCTYGIGAGSDPSAKEMRLMAHVGAGTVSMTTAREQLDFLDDPELEPLRRLRELAQDAIAAGVAQQAQMGQPQLAAELFKLLQREDVDADEIMEELVEKIINPAPPEGAPPITGPQDPAAALMGAESLARGGIPGNAEQAPPPASFGLPPMGELINQDSKQAI